MGRSEGKPYSEYLTDKYVRKSIKNQFRLELIACRELLKAADKQLYGWQGSKIDAAPFVPWHRASGEALAVREFVRGQKIANASFRLSASGFGEPAAMLNRALLESLLVYLWIQENSKEAELRFDESWKYDRHLEALKVVQAKRASRDEVEDLLLSEEERKVCVAKFGKFGQLSWTGINSIDGLYKAVKNRIPDSIRDLMGVYLEVGHTDNNRLLHSSARGLDRAGDEKRFEGGLWVQPGPTTVHVEHSLFQMWFLFSQAFLNFSADFRFPKVHKTAKMVKRNQHLFTRPSEKQENLELKGKDECWCGSGRKFKKCHGQ